MFDAFKAANGQRNAELREYDEIEHDHNQDGYADFHDGQEGHEHDNDGHIHEHYMARYNAGPGEHSQHHSHYNGDSDVQKHRDGPSGHHHDNNGHDHKKHNDALTKAEENKGVNDDLRQFTLIISKLLFQLSRM